MARRIQSPGVQITEFDYSERPPLASGTSIFVTGFADQGPTDEVNFIQSVSDFQLIYGNPTNAAERYFYHTVKAALNSTATVLTNRMPYGSGGGDGFGSYYTALVYPTKFLNLGTSGGTAQKVTLTVSNATSAAFAIQGSNGLVYALTFNSEWSSAVNTLTAAVNTLGGVVANVTGAVGSTQSFAAAVANYFENLNSDLFDIGYSGSTITFTNSAIGTVTNAPSGISGKTSFTTIAAGTSSTYGEITSNLNGVSGIYFFGAPKSFSLSKEEYEGLIDGSGYTWSATASSISEILSSSDFGHAGMIVLNERQTAVDQSFQGYYIGLADNFDADNQGSSFNKIRGVKSVASVGTGNGISDFINVPTTTLAFSLTSAASSNTDSLARSIETGSNGYVIGNKADYDDVFNLGVYKLQNSVFQDDPTKLVFSLQELYTGSVTNNFRQFAAPTGGEPVPYSLQTIVGNRSPNATILINPYINNVAPDSLGKGSSYSTNSPYLTLKKARLMTQTLVDGAALNNSLSAYVGFNPILGTSVSSIVNTICGQVGLADSIYPLGTYNPIGNTNLKVIGSVNSKVEKALDRIKDPELFDVDLLCEGGLGTIYAFTKIANLSAYDDTEFNSDFDVELKKLQANVLATGVSNDIVTYYQEVANKFLSLAQSEKDGGRGDTFFIADPIRHFFVQGANSKIIDKQTTTGNYQKIYYSLRNLYDTFDTSYMGSYGNWTAVIDDFTGLKTWVPVSGYLAAIMANTDAGTGPWEAPAGFNRGILRNVIDIGWSPNQRQRDDIYKLGINPIASFPGQGIVVYGQKTTQNKPSAFDRINVRRNFLFMEKTVKDIMKFFVFEPNTKFTRDRVLATLNPFFINIQANGGLYDFLVVCDERNNTDALLEDNTLVVDIYLKPTRTAEFVLVNFYATRQSASFEELVAR